LAVVTQPVSVYCVHARSTTSVLHPPTHSPFITPGFLTLQLCTLPHSNPQPPHLRPCGAPRPTGITHVFQHLLTDPDIIAKHNPTVVSEDPWMVTLDNFVTSEEVPPPPCARLTHTVPHHTTPYHTTPHHTTANPSPANTHAAPYQQTYACNLHLWHLHSVDWPRACLRAFPLVQRHNTCHSSCQHTNHPITCLRVTVFLQPSATVSGLSGRALRERSRPTASSSATSTTTEHLTTRGARGSAPNQPRHRACRTVSVLAAFRKTLTLISLVARAVSVMAAFRKTLTLISLVARAVSVMAAFRKTLTLISVVARAVSVMAACRKTLTLISLVARAVSVMAACRKTLTLPCLVAIRFLHSRARLST
jgi:hypothetical protein